MQQRLSQSPSELVKTTSPHHHTQTKQSTANHMTCISMKASAHFHRRKYRTMEKQEQGKQKEEMTPKWSHRAKQQQGKTSNWKNLQKRAAKQIFIPQPQIRNRFGCVQGLFPLRQGSCSNLVRRSSQLIQQQILLQSLFLQHV